MYYVQQILFKDILPIWQDKLWPNRKSSIETHSVMTWPFSTNDNKYEMAIFKHPVHFFGVYDNSKLIGVNSGHLTSFTEFRSRGLWVDPDYRGNGIAQLLLESTKQVGIWSGARLIWSIPRITAVSAYTKAGFYTIGNQIDDGMEFGPNIYCSYSV